jgi:hypothetical protein
MKHIQLERRNIVGDGLLQIFVLKKSNKFIGEYIKLNKNYNSVC